MSTYETNRYAFPASAITSGTFANARLSSGSVTQHVDLSNLNASNLTSGTVPNDRYGTPTFSASNLTALNASQLTSGSIPDSLFSTIPASAVTQHVSAVADARGSWSPGSSDHSFTHSQAKYVKVGRLCFVSYRGKFNSYTSNTPENNQFYFTGLPFTSWNGGHHVGGGFGLYPGWGSVMTQVDANSTRIYLTLTSGDEFKSRTTYGNKGRMSKYYSSYPQVLNRPTDSRHIYWECTYITAS